MNTKLSVSTVIVLLTFGMMFYISIEKANAGFGIPPVCCINPDTNTCVGCESGCSTLPDYCNENGGMSADEFAICVDGGLGSATCAASSPDATGCCVLEDGCRDNLDEEDCLSNSSGQVWLIEQSCAAQPACERNVPALSQWGLIAMAGLLGIIGFIVIRRRQLTINS